LAQPPPVSPCQAAQRAHVLEHEIELRLPASGGETRVGDQIDTRAGELGEDPRALTRAIGDDGIAVVDLSHSVRHERLLSRDIPVVGGWPLLPVNYRGGRRLSLEEPVARTRATTPRPTPMPNNPHRKGGGSIWRRTRR